LKNKTVYALVLSIIVSMILTSISVAATNPCNPCGAMGRTLYVNDNRNVFTFESKAPLEKIVGTSSKIMGKMQVNPKDITKNMMVKFELDLASMKTGIGLRDEHMRDNFLETAKYPKAVLTVEKLTNVSQKALMDQKPITVDAVGTLELHGVLKPVTIKNVKVTYFKESNATKAKMPGDLLHIEGGFSIKLPDYNIKVPQMIMLKLDENIKVNVDVFATTAMPSSMAANPCNPCVGKKAKNPCNPCSGKK
jgi:polyisoprenoid-binding protein YceI